MMIPESRPPLPPPSERHRAADPPSPEVTKVLTGSKVRLREIKHSDLATLIRFDRDAARLGNSPQTDGYRHWAAHRAHPTASENDFQLAIEALRSRRLVGSMCITQTEPGSGRFSYGIGIAPQHQRNGYAEDSIRVLLHYLFHQRKFAKCVVGIYGDNQPSIRLHRKIGFREENRTYDPALGDTGLLVTMSITSREFTWRRLTRLPNRR